MSYKAKKFELEIPVTHHHKGEGLYHHEVQQLLRDALKCYIEFGHIDNDNALGREETCQYILDTCFHVRTADSEYMEKSRDKFVALTDGIIKDLCEYSPEEHHVAEAMAPRVKDYRYNFERAMSCPVMAVHQCVVQDSDERWKIKLDVKYDTSD